MMSLGNSHAQTYLLPGPVRAMEALQNICKVSRQCLVRGQCVNAAMQMQNNAKTHTSGRCLMACDLSSTAACFCGGDLNRVGVSSRPSVGEHMRDAKSHHAPCNIPGAFFSLRRQAPGPGNGHPCKYL